MENEEKKVFNKQSIRIILIACLILVLAVGGVLAKYIADNKREAEMLSADFHISSNYLDAAGASYTVSDWGDHGITILLHNYETENIALIAEEDIKYTISTGNAQGWTVAVEDENENTVTPVNGEYTLPSAEGQRATHTLQLTYTGTGDPTEVTVTVNTTAPYTEELKATFTLYGYDLPNYVIEDKGNYCLITLYSNDYEGEVQIQWDGEKFSPDNTNPRMANWQDTESVRAFSVEAYSTYEFIFVKKTEDSFATVQDSGQIILMKEGANNAG